jgi:hypothetical protein
MHGLESSICAALDGKLSGQSEIGDASHCENFALRKKSTLHHHIIG